MQKDEEILIVKNKEILKLKSTIKAMTTEYRDRSGEESQFYNSRSQPNHSHKNICDQNMDSSIE